MTLDEFPKVLPAWTTADEWCHAECFQRWRELPRDIQGFVGGHVHYDEERRQWRVPQPCPPLKEWEPALIDRP
jgi:hypothetical protein